MNPPSRSWPVLRRVAATGLPYLPAMGGVFLASTAYSVGSSFMIWFMGNALFAGAVPVGRLPGPLRDLLAPLGEAVSGLSAARMLAWGAGGALVVVAASLAKDLGSGAVVWRVVRDLRQRLCDHFLRLDLGFFQGRKAGDLISRVNNDVAYTQAAVNFLFSEMLQNPVDMACGLGALLCLGYGRLTLAALLVIPLVAWPLRLLSRRIRRAAEHGAESLGEITQATQQILGGIRVIKAFRAEAREGRAFSEVNARFFRKMMSIVRARALSAAIMEFMAYGVFATGGCVALKWLFREGVLEALRPEDLVVFMMIGVQRIFGPLRSVVKSLNNLQANLPGAARVFELLDAQPAVRDAPGAAALAPLSREIVFEGVRFAYDGAPVLKGVDLRVRKGWLVAVVGPSGAGKSTLLSLLPRFYDPHSGRICLDGVDLRAATRDSLVAQMALVAQDPFLFHATIRENIAYGRPGASQAEIEGAARAANIHDAILQMPRGYDTVVGERGLRLSGGERQRVAIARAVLKDAAILILDEATSELDSASERMVQEALDRLMAGRTTLVIAHRLSTVLHADRIVVMEDGRIVEEGTHAELLALGGLYRRLHAIQFAPGRPA